MNRPRRSHGVLVAVAVVISGSSLAGATPQPADYRVLSTAADGTPANSYSYQGDISADGRWVAFASNASNLVPNDTNNEIDIFVKDVRTGAIDRVNVGPDGSESPQGDPAGDPRISADGRFVSYTSLAPNLVGGDTNAIWDIFVYDRHADTTERVSVTNDGRETTRTNSGSAISADGRYVAFTSSGALVPADTNGSSDIYVRDRIAHTTERVSVSSTGAQSTTIVGSLTPSISADGRYVTFRSPAMEFVDGDVNTTWDVFVHDRAQKQTRLVSTAADGTIANDQSNCATISGNGRYVSFTSAASNLVPSDTNRSFDVFVKDLLSGRVDRVLLTHAGEEVNGDFRWYSCEQALSHDGRLVFFHTLAQGLEPHSDTGSVNLFSHDRLSGLTERIAVGNGGRPLDGSAAAPRVTPDGRYVTFLSSSSNIVPGDENGHHDLYLLDRGPANGARRLSMAPQGDFLRVSAAVSFESAPVTAAIDATGDGVGGIDLRGTRVMFRPSREDLAVIWDVESLPGARGVNVPGSTALAVSPGVTAPPELAFDIEFKVAGGTYRVTAKRQATAPERPAFHLHKCARGSCLQVSPLRGGYGTHGDDVVAVVPLEVLGLTEGETLTSVAASVQAAGLGTVDTLPLPAGGLPIRSATLTLASGEDSSTWPIPVADGGVDTMVDWSGVIPGVLRATLSTCLGDTCSSESRTVVRP